MILARSAGFRARRQRLSLLEILEASYLLAILLFCFGAFHDHGGVARCPTISPRSPGDRGVGDRRRLFAIQSRALARLRRHWRRRSADRRGLHGSASVIHASARSFSHDFNILIPAIYRTGGLPPPRDSAGSRSSPGAALGSSRQRFDGGDSYRRAGRESPLAARQS